MSRPPRHWRQRSVLRLNLGWLDYVLVAIYFVFVLGIGFIARQPDLDQPGLLPVRPLGCPRG